MRQDWSAVASCARLAFVVAMVTVSLGWRGSVLGAGWLLVPASWPASLPAPPAPPVPLDPPPAGTLACSSVLAGLLEEGQGALCVSVSGGSWGLGDAAPPREVGGSKSLSPGPMSAPLPWG